MFLIAQESFFLQWQLKPHSSVLFNLKQNSRSHHVRLQAIEYSNGNWLTWPSLNICRVYIKRLHKESVLWVDVILRRTTSTLMVPRLSIYL